MQHVLMNVDNPQQLQNVILQPVFHQQQEEFGSEESEEYQGIGSSVRDDDLISETSEDDDNSELSMPYFM